MPIYTYQPGAADGNDVYLGQIIPNKNYETDAAVCVGDYAAANDVSRGLIKFDLSTLLGFIILSANLELTVVVDYSSNARSLRAYRQLRAWTEIGATWNKYDGTNNWQSAGGFGANDCEQTDIGSVSIPANPSGVYSISLDKSKVQEWVDGRFANNGVLLKVDTESSDLVAWHSSDSSTAASRPKITIEYSYKVSNIGMSPNMLI